ncbi:OmpA family protein [Parasutterella excrementihominis]|uniref:OmpA family protein n=1 Tax=Parasutterella excrementihominis TaxID=487175 RepID=UPI002665C6CF|nr:OmpA family protein [Parasutterella excrementihominis]
MFRKKSQQGGVNYLASVADLMAGLLFILFIALTYLSIELDRQSNLLKNGSELQRELLYLQDKTKRIEADNLQKQKEIYELKQKISFLAKEDREQLKTKILSLEEKIAEAEKVKRIFENSNETRASLLNRIKDALAKQNINVQVDDQVGVLRIPEDELTFRTGRSDLTKAMQSRLQTIRDVLVANLVCYSNLEENASAKSCSEINPDGHKLDAIFIEGHTDNQPFGFDPTGKMNRRLSTDRANAVYEELLGKSSLLSAMKNAKGQKLFSLSGYGEERPVPEHEHTTPTDDKVNRRIELRFVMSAPKIKEGS